MTPGCRRPPWLLLLCTVLVGALTGGCMVPGPGLPPLRDGRLLWLGDLEGGDLRQFQDTPWNRVGGTPPAVVTSPVRSGRYAVALGIPGTSTPADGICCGSRNELMPAFRDLVPGDDLYLGFSVYLEPGFPVDTHWQTICQFKQNFDGSPPLGLYVEDGYFRLEGGFGHPGGAEPFTVPLRPAVTGRWVDWVVHVVFSADPTVAYADVWADETQVLSHFAPPSGTMYHSPSGTDGSYLKIGYYRNPNIAVPGVVVFDDLRIGTTYGSVRHLESSS